MITTPQVQMLSLRHKHEGRGEEKRWGKPLWFRCGLSRLLLAFISYFLTQLTLFYTFWGIKDNKRPFFPTKTIQKLKSFILFKKILEALAMARPELADTLIYFLTVPHFHPVPFSWHFWYVHFEITHTTGQWIHYSWIPACFWRGAQGPWRWWQTSMKWHGSPHRCWHHQLSSLSLLSPSHLQKLNTQNFNWG